MANKIVIIGAGGHGKVVCDAILLQKKYEILGFVDASIPVGTVVTSKYKVIAAQEDIDTLKDKAGYFVVAIGNNQVRKDLFLSTKEILKPATIIHPSVVIGSDVTIGEGTVVLANAVINANSSIGENTIINSGVVVDHDCSIGANIHLSIGVLVGSNSTIKNGYFGPIGEIINSFTIID